MRRNGGSADVEAYEDKQKELEKLVNPIMAKLYKGGGGGGGDSGGDDDYDNHDEL